MKSSFRQMFVLCTRRDGKGQQFQAEQRDDAGTTIFVLDDHSTIKITEPGVWEVEQVVVIHESARKDFRIISVRAIKLVESINRDRLTFRWDDKTVGGWKAVEKSGDRHDVTTIFTPVAWQRHLVALPRQRGTDFRPIWKVSGHRVTQWYPKFRMIEVTLVEQFAQDVISTLGELVPVQQLAKARIAVSGSSAAKLTLLPKKDRKPAKKEHKPSSAHVQKTLEQGLDEAMARIQQAQK